MNKVRYYEIDLLRFVAAFAVMMFHYTFRGFAADNMSPLAFPVLGEVFKYGSLGVNLFFMISGFVILLTALNSKASKFVITRMTRIYPAYWAGVTLTALVIFYFGGEHFRIQPSQYFVNLTMLHHFIGVKHIDGVYWSLIVELKFYLLIFLLIVFKQLNNIKLYLTIWLILTAIDAFFKLPGPIAFFVIPSWAPYFIAGALFYLIRTEGQSIGKYMLLGLTFALSLFIAGRNVQGFIDHYQTDYSYAILLFTITAFYLIFLLIALSKTTWLSSKSFALYGALTYPLYLVHQNIGFIFFNHFDNESYKYLTLLGMIALSMTLAYLINRYIERIYSQHLKAFLTNGLQAIKSGSARFRYNEQ